MSPARIFAIGLGLSLFAADASACLREKLDDRAIQWSHLIVRAKLVETGQVTAIDHRASPSTSASRPEDPGPASGFVVMTFEVTDTFDGPAPGESKLRVLRLVTPNAPKTNCTASLSGKRPGDAFVLLLRRCDQTEMTGVSKDAIPPEVMKDAFIIVHAIAAAEADDGTITGLKQMIQDVRHAEAGATDESIRPQVDAIASAADETEAEDAQKALLELGPKSLPALRAKMNDTTVKESAQSRVRHVIEELATPPLNAEAP